MLPPGATGTIRDCGCDRNRATIRTALAPRCEEPGRCDPLHPNADPSVRERAIQGRLPELRLAGRGGRPARLRRATRRRPRGVVRPERAARRRRVGRLHPPADQGVRALRAGHLGEHPEPHGGLLPTRVAPGGTALAPHGEGPAVHRARRDRRHARRRRARARRVPRGAVVAPARTASATRRSPPGCGNCFRARFRRRARDGRAAPRSAVPSRCIHARRTRFVTIVRGRAGGHAGRAGASVERSSGPARKPASASQPPAGSAAERVAKARELLDDDPLLTRRNVELAEQFALEAIAKDPSSAEAFAAAAWANFRFIQSNYEDTPKRRADLRSHAEKAKLLDPESINAELALCGLLIVNRDWAEAGQRLREAGRTRPDEPHRAPRSGLGRRPHRPRRRAATPEGQANGLDRLRAVSPLGRSYADSQLAAMHWRRGNYVEADRLLDGVFASGHPVRASYLMRLLVLLYGWGDLAAARDFAATIPSKLLLEDVFIAHVDWLSAALRGARKGARDPRPQPAGPAPGGPRRDAHRRCCGGTSMPPPARPAAAALQWREAIEDDTTGCSRPGRTAPLLDGRRPSVLAMLGERKAAAAEYALARELGRNPAAGSIAWAQSYDYHLAAGDREGAIVRLDRLVQRDYGRWPSVYTRLRDDPLYRALHADPRVKAMLERGARWLAERRRPASRDRPLRKPGRPLRPTGWYSGRSRSRRKGGSDGGEEEAGKGRGGPAEKTDEGRERGAGRREGARADRAVLAPGGPHQAAQAVRATTSTSRSSRICRWSSSSCRNGCACRASRSRSSSRGAMPPARAA